MQIHRSKLKISAYAPVLFLILAICFFSSGVFAYNGFLLTGYGTESVLMGGADVAVSRDAFAANNNPSGMMQLTGKTMNIEVVPWVVPYYGHSDSIGNYHTQQDNSFGFYGNGAYARRFENTPFAAGIAVVVQGGVGWDFKGLNTGFGNRDDASSLFSIARLAPAVAWQVNDKLNLGAMLGINYFAGNQELFPDTSTENFSGFSFEDAYGIGISYKLGLQYQAAKNVVIGITYGSKTSIPMEKGQMKVNYTNTFPGLGTVQYDEAEMTGFHLPEEFAIGVSFRPIPRLLVSLQTKWYNWSEALNVLELTATDPRDEQAPQVVSIASAVEFKDQQVLEAGIAYDYSENTVVLAGVNYGKNPVPNNNLSPIFQPVQSMHYMMGLQHKTSKEWQWSAGFQWYVPRAESYDSPIFGQDTSVNSNGLLIHLSIERSW